MRFIDLFSGIGGFHLGLTRASKKYECVYANEWDKYAASIYRKHFSCCDTSDIRAVATAEIPDHDLLCGGFPCQSFSIAGKRGGFKDTRGTLFFEIARVARAKRTPYLFLENVKGLLSHDAGNTFATIITSLDELGYDCQWQVLNSKNFGVPQNRERVFIIGHLRGKPRPKVFPFGESSTTNTESRITGKDVSYVIDANYYKGFTDYHVKRSLRQGVVVGTFRTHKDGQGFRELQQGISPTIPARAREDGSGQPIIATGVNRPSRGIEPRSDGLASTIKSGSSGTQRPTALINMKIRRLTPIECERLQGFPDGWTEGISDTQRYKCLGNAVTVNVIEAIGKLLS